MWKVEIKCVEKLEEMRKVNDLLMFHADYKNT